MEEEKRAKSDKRQTEFLVGIALIILGIIFACFALMQPRVSSEADFAVSASSVNVNISKTASSNVVNKSNESVSSSYSLDVNYPLNLNTCTVDELKTIENVGDTRANAIISYREYLGGYTSVEQLKNISGIGESVYESIAPYVTV